MDLRLYTGNSGNRLIPTVTKIGSGCQQEGAYCQYLGSDVAPVIYSIIPDGYVMEALPPASWDPDLLVRIEEKLESTVWNRPALPVTTDKSWREYLTKFGVHAPLWVIDNPTCLVHGDPTASNALERDGNLILCDPRPPREFIPQCKTTDMGRILQSYWGWEYVAYGLPILNYASPKFFRNPVLFDQAKFWVGAAAARIEYLELSRDKRNKREDILNWCRTIREHCNV